MTERLPRLHPPFADPRRQALHAAIVGGRRGKGPQAFHLTASDGSLVGPFGLMLQAPHLGGPLQELGAAVRFATSFTDRAREVAILTVAAVTRSDYEQYAHERVGAMVGLSAAELDGIRHGGVRAHRRRRPRGGDDLPGRPPAGRAPRRWTTTTTPPRSGCWASSGSSSSSCWSATTPCWRR